MQQESVPLTGRRYVIHGRIGEGGMGVVYRTLDRLYGREVALKRLALPTQVVINPGALGGGSPPATPGALLPQSAQEFAPLSSAHAKTIAALEYSADAFAHPPRTLALRSTVSPLVGEDLRLALAQEFHTLSSLRHPHIISVLDYGFDQDRQPFFTMELLQGAQTLCEAAAGLSQSQQVALLLQVLQALTYLHRRGVLHRDLKPANILVVHGASGPHVKLLDFGLAVLRRQFRARDGEISGTLGYIAPEVLHGTPPSESSDLYAFGVIAFELLVGRAPLPEERDSELILAVTTEDLDWSATGLSPTLNGFLQQLLARAPAARYASVEATTQALAAAAHAQPLENDGTRESFLQAAELVGREKEMTQLRGALSDALVGRGSVWLIGGESGVGKSRLCDELRTQAQVRGAQVLRGQAVSHGGAGVFLFTEALRALSLEVDLSELEASVLKTIVVDLSMLLGRQIADAPALSAQATRARLLLVAESILLRSQNPMVLLLEDLQWAEPDSIDFLRRLVEQVRSRPLLVLGTFRDEERPDLPAELPKAHVLKLPRLRPEAIAALAESMLGATGRNTELVELLLRESEGNTFFIVEVMRTLAEAAGGLSEIAHRQLPQKVFAGGVQAALQRRLGQVPLAMQPLLKVAAVAGRQLDVKVLQAAEPTMDLESWLRRCADVAVLELSEQQWRFPHDKLRERLLADLTAEQRRHLHAGVATAIASSYTDLGPHAAALSYHHEQAGDLRQAGRYAAMAAELSMQRGALADARTLLKQALTLYPHTAAPHHLHVRLHRLLVSALFGLGKMAECSDVLQRAFADLGIPLPVKTTAWTRALLREVSRQALHRLNTGFIRHATTDQDSATLEELFYLYELMAEYYIWHNRPLESLYGIFLTTNTAERQGHISKRAIGFSVMSIVFCSTPLKGIFNYYISLGESLVSETDTETTRFQYRAMGISCLFAGQLEKAKNYVKQGLVMSRAVGDAYAQMHLLLAEWIGLRFSGEFAAARRSADTMMALARSTENLHFQTWAHGLIGSDYLRLGEHANAHKCFDAAAALSKNGGYREAGLYYEGLRALNLFRNGDRELAMRFADEALQSGDRLFHTHNAAQEGFPACVEALLQLWATSTQPSERRVLEEKTQRALRMLGRFALVFPNGRPALHLLRGQYRWQYRNYTAGRKDLEHSEALAQELGMPYEAALARAWRGRVMKGEAGRAALLSARERLRLLGAKWDAAQVEHWLAAL